MHFSTVPLAPSLDFRYLQINIRHLSSSLLMIKLVQSPPGSGSAYSYVDMNILLRTLLSAFPNTNTHVYHQRIRRARLAHASLPHVKNSTFLEDLGVPCTKRWTSSHLVQKREFLPDGVVREILAQPLSPCNLFFSSMPILQ